MSQEWEQGGAHEIAGTELVLGTKAGMWPRGLIGAVERSARVSLTNCSVAFMRPAHCVESEAC